MPEKLLFTMAKLSSLKPYKSGRRTVYDEKVPGLTLTITEAGGKSFYLYGRFGGRPRRHRIGAFPDLSIDTARDQARKLIAGFADGKDPTETRRKQRGELTIGELWALYLEFHAENHKKPRSIAEDRGLWNRYLSSWTGRKLSSITHGDVQSHHSRIGRANGKFAANRMLSLLSKMFNVAKDHGEWKQANPTDGVKRFAEKSRDRFLRTDEIPRFLAALNAEPNQLIADAFRLMLWTGARKSNVLSMRWDAVDLAANVWRIPDTKQGEPQTVPLIPEAVNVLTRLRSSAEPHQTYVFPARVAGTKAGHLVDVTKAWRSVIAAAELPELRLHDLRRTMGSWQALGGASLQVIGKSLGHKNASTTEIYSRLSIDPVRQSMERAGAAMVATTKPVTQPASDDDEPLGVG